MPCDQYITTTTEFSEGTDLELMKDALAAGGYMASDYQGGLAFYHQDNYARGGKFINGVFTTTTGQAVDVAAIKRAYALASVKKTAAKMGWKVQMDAKNPNKLQIRRRA